MKNLVSIAALLFSINGFSYQTPEADSMWRYAGTLSQDEAMEYLLSNSYHVYNKSMEDGVEWLNETKSFAIQLNNKIFEGRADLGLGVVWYLHGDYEKAIDYYLSALAIFEAENNSKWIGRCCNELSVYTRKQEQSDKALEYLDRSYEECMKVQDYECVETSLNNRGVVYELMGNYELAIHNYRKAQAMAERSDNQIGLSYIFNNLAECFRLQGAYDSSAHYLDRSTKIRKAQNDIQGIAINWVNKGELYYSIGEFEKANACYDTCIRIAKEVKYTDLIRYAHEQASKSYKAVGEIEQSFFHLERTFFLKDSLLNSDKLKALSEAEVKFQTEKTEKDRLLEKQKRTSAELKVSNRNKWIYGILGALLTVIFLALYLIQLRAKKAQAEKDKAILSEREKGLSAVFDATEEERQRIAKDLHDGVGQKMSGLKMAWNNLSISFQSKLGEDAQKLDELSKILDETASEVRDISHQMMPKVLQDYGLVDAITEMLDKSLKYAKIEYEFESFNFEGRLNERVEISLYRVCQELINNIIKHSGASVVSVQLFKNGDNLILIVEDNGKWINEGQTQEGHGLLNIKSRLNTIDGRVNYEASPSAGTTATIRIRLE